MGQAVTRELDGQALRAANGFTRRVDRLREMRSLFAARESVAVEELAERLAISHATARRDLAVLADEGLVVRTHGGAVRADRAREVPLRYRAGSHAEEKRRIALRAAQLVQDGSVLGITGGTTAMEVARALGALRDVIVVTNALNVATELGMHRDISVTVTGGAVRPVSLELSGPIAERTLEDYNIDIAFVGADGVDGKAGVTTHNEAEARTNRALITRAHRVVVVVDRSKLGEVRFAKICDLATVDLLITDSGAPPEAFEALAPHVPEILLA